MKPRVIDISHHNTVHDLAATAASGVWGVIHKASQGSGYRDPDYAPRRSLAKSAGMLWGAYHFNDGSPVDSQVANFLAAARPGPDTLLVLDFEDNAKSNMSPQQMVQFLHLMEQRVGHKIAIYSGNRLKESIGRLSPADRAYVASHPLWLCQYGPTPKLPPGFDHSFLWQYTDGVVGPGPHGVPGVTGEVDLNAFNGTREELEATWQGPSADASVPHSSSHSAQAEDDQPDDAPTAPSRSDDEPEPLPPFLRPGGDTPTGGLNVQPVHAGYDVGVEVVQRELDAMGYHEVGDVDGLWGGKTAAGIKAFFIDRGLDDAAQMGPTLNNEIARAKRDGWSRPIAPSRANAKPADVAPKIESVRVSLWSKLYSQIGAAAAALGIGGSTISSVYSSAQGTLSPVHDALSKVDPVVWLSIIGLISLAVWYATNRAAKAATKDYNTGRTN